VVTANAFCNNAKSEVTNAVMGTHTYGYAYDPIGNRLQSATDTAGGQPDVTAYAANCLNQYSTITYQSNSLQPNSLSPSYDADGHQKSAKPKAQPLGDRDFEAVRTHGARSGIPRRSGNCNMLTCTLPTDDWHFFWDAENRLVCASNATTVVRNTYDHQSRRIRKDVSAYNASTSNFEPVICSLFLYDGWTPLAETSWAQDQQWKTHFYTWGFDLSGTPQDAGGVGGLLAVTTCNTQPVTCNTYFPTFDANGNVTAYIDFTGATAARFEYDAFGNTISETLSNFSTLELSNFPFRFSTKYLDPETGLIMYQRRAYSAKLGRWLSRDPIEEQGDTPNLYCMIQNDPLNDYDAFGLFGAGRLYAKSHGFGVKVFGISLDSLFQQRIPSGHSDFTGGDYFDFVKEDIDLLTGPYNPFSTGNHFLPPDAAKQHIDAAVSVCPCDKNKFERAMHQLQDNNSHYEKGYEYKPFLKVKNLGMGHAFARLFGDYPDDDEKGWKKAEAETVKTLKEIWDVKCGSRKK